MCDRPGGEVDRAVEIMNAAGAVDIDRHVERYRQTGYERYDEKAPAYSHEEAVAERERFRGPNEGGSVPVIEEELQVGKRAVRRGGVRVYSRVVDQPVEKSVELREERVTVDRRAVNRPVERGEMSGLRDQSIEVQEVTEEPVVQKRARVREEVVVGKETEDADGKGAGYRAPDGGRGRAAGRRDLAGRLRLPCGLPAGLGDAVRVIGRRV